MTPELSREPQLSSKNQKILIQALPRVKKISLAAGELLLKYAKKLDKLKTHHKPGEGLASEADLSSEKLIEKSLNKYYPDFFFLGEEQAFSLAGKNKNTLFEKCQNYEWSWVVDPLDGTNNFLNGIDSYAVCIGLLYQGKSVFGVVYRPSTQEFYWGIQGQKAFYQKGSSKKIQLTGPDKQRALGQSLFATGFSTEKGERFNWEFEAFKTIASQLRGIRRFGSAALDLCWVAHGKLQGFWESGLAPWDMAAAGVICREAGVEMSDFNGDKFHPFVSNILAASPENHSLIRELISKIPRA